MFKKKEIYLLKLQRLHMILVNTVQKDINCLLCRKSFYLLDAYVSCIYTFYVSMIYMYLFIYLFIDLSKKERKGD